MLRRLSGAGSRLPFLSRRLLCAESPATNVDCAQAETSTAVADAAVVAPNELDRAVTNASSNESPAVNSSPSEIACDSVPLDGAEEAKAASTVSAAEPEQSVRLRSRDIPFSTDGDILLRFNSMKPFQRKQMAWLFSAAMEADNPKLVTAEVFWKAMPTLVDLKYTGLIRKSLLFVQKHDLRLSTTIFNCAAGGLMREGHFEDVRSIIDHMWTLPSRSQPNATTYNQLIGAYFYSGKVEEAYDVLNDMKNKMIYPNWATYHSLIAGCLCQRETQRAFETLLAVEEQNFKMSALTIGQLLVMCADENEIPAVMQLLPRFQSAVPRYAKEVEVIANRKSYDLTLNQLHGDGMMSRGIPRLEISGIMSLMRAGFRNANPELAEMGMDLFTKWYENSSIPESAWYCLVGAYAASKEFTSAFDVLARMRKCGIEPSVRDLNEVLVKPLSADMEVLDKQYYRLINVLKPNQDEANGQSEASVDETPPSADSTVLASPEAPASEAPVVEDSDHLVENASDESIGDVPDDPGVPSFPLKDARGEDVLSVSSAGFVPVVLPAEERTVGIAELNAIIAACSAVGDLDRAFHTYDEANGLGLAVNTDTFNALIVGCISDGHYVGGVRVAEELKESGVPFDGETIHVLVRLCIRCGKLVEARKWILVAQEENIPVASTVFQTLVRKLMQLGKLADVRDVLAIAEDCGVSSRSALARVDIESVRHLHLLKGDLEAIPDEERFSPRGSLRRSPERLRSGTLVDGGDDRRHETRGEDASEGSV